MTTSKNPDVSLALTLHYGLTIFLSAFLLFQVQPMLGKMILPWFGGSASVWTICMLFFQTVLLLGYCYSHWVVRHLRPMQQSLLHAALLLLSLAFLPIAPDAAWRPTGAESPTLRILGLLLVSIGLPYFVLSTTGPLLQVWFSRERFGLVPYRLFALSNFGSMIALFAYPTLVEPTLATRAQSLAWSSLFVVFATACALLAWRGRNGSASQPAVPETPVGHAVATPAPGSSEMLLWAMLATCPSLLMVADTSYMTENIAPIPLLWVGPLGLYLLSFIFCFERHGWYQRRIFLPLVILALATLAYLPRLGVSGMALEWSVGINLIAFFVVCMVCHGELAKRQPTPEHLTVYYLMLALGGALGGFFVGVVAPALFNSNYELSVGIVLTACVSAWAALSALPERSARFRLPIRVGVGLFIVVLAVLRIDDHYEENEGADLITRNFYGTIKVFTNPQKGYRSMMHGQIVHGRQFITSGREQEPTTYYGTDSGVGHALRIKAAHGPIHAGLVGTGVGTLASYGRTGDRLRHYEIDPQVIAIARQRFSFLANSPAENTVVLGDARLQLSQEGDQDFDVLVIDAFSGDSVPAHLLTREAFELYTRQLKANGVIAVHITNRFLDLRPVLADGAHHIGHAARVIDGAADNDRLVYRSRWVLMSRDTAVFADPALKNAPVLSVTPAFKPWTDSYSSLLSVFSERHVD